MARALGLAPTRSLRNMILVLALVHGTARGQIQITCNPAGNVAAIGEPVTFTIRATPPDMKPRRFVLLRNYSAEVQTGVANYDSPTSVTANPTQPGALFLAVDKDGDGMNPWYGDATCATVLVSPEQLQPGSPAPADFAAFWDGVKKQMDCAAGHCETRPDNLDHRRGGVRLEP